MGDWQTDRIRAVESGEATDVARAMNTVLAAERDAAAAIEACRADGARALDAARLAARARIERAEAVAQQIHARTERVAAARAAALAGAAVSAAEQGRPLAAAIDELAAWLVGDDDG
jgi:vacuolar-type H+-ATPase subunit H